MDDIIVLHEGTQLESDYLAEFREKRVVRQNLFYLADGASSFYLYRTEDFAEIRCEDEVCFFQDQVLWEPGQTVGFVSLGCGNAEAEKPLLREIHASGVQVRYFGVDSSRAMLELAGVTLAQESFAVTRVLGDFTRAEFAVRLRELTAGCDVMIYAMLGATFGNFVQSEIAGWLARLAPPGAYLYLDVVPKSSQPTEVAQLRERLTHLPDNLALFFERLLETLCIPRESGELFGAETPETALDALRVTAFFRARERFTFPCMGDELTVEPGETIELMSVRAYDPVALQAFMSRHGFAPVGTYVPDVGSLHHLWQRFLLRRE